jgi:uncharacterized membrane protein
LDVSTRVLITSGIVAAMLLAVIATSASFSNISLTSLKAAFAQGEQKFTAKLTGKDEVPPKNTKATGTAEFNVTADGKTMTYKVNVMNMDKVTQAHIHSGKQGVNGPPVVMNGMLSQGNITSSDLVGPLKGKQISDLVKLINDGQAYVNVHTETNPKGEIRGEVSK